jgi:aconitate hydratase
MDNKIGDIKWARCLLHLWDSVTTDHISPAWKFYPESPAWKYLKKNGVTEKDFNSYGSRRWNHEVMIRGTFANVKVDNNLASQKWGYTKHVPSWKEMFVYEAAEKYKEEKTPLIVIWGKAYGNGSSRDWAAKWTLGLGVKAVIAESYERIHRSNLIGMWVLPLQFTNGKSASELGIDGTEEFDILWIENAKPWDILTLVVTKNWERKEYEIRSRIDTVREKEQYEVWGIMPSVVQNNL